MAETHNLIRLIMMVTVLIPLILVFAYLFYKLRKGIGKPVREDWSRARAMLSYHPVCPKCGGNMTPGFVLANRGIHWRDEPKGSSAVPIWDAVENTVNLGFGARYNRAFRCPACKVITIDHSMLLSGK